MAQTADQTGIASLGMLDRMMGPLKAEKARNVITTIGDMTPMAPEVRKMMGKEPIGMGDMLMASTGLIIGLPIKVAGALAKGTGALDEAFDILKSFKSTDDIEATLSSMFKEGMKKRAAASADDVASPDFIEGTNLTNNAQRLLRKAQDEGLVNRNFSLQVPENLKAGGYVYKD
tara:strand:- start:3779 stop:4300 length:522 start_codon:yes stop_codon:yes gene_type:complete